MRLFRRKAGNSTLAVPDSMSPDPTADRMEAIAGFWRWWRLARAAVADRCEAGDAVGVRELLDPRVRAVHPRLQWETASARTARHALVVSSGGDPGLRALAERWRRAGPGRDAMWEFHAARQADPSAFDQQIILGGRTLALGAASVAAHADDRRCRVDIAVHHPLMADLSEPARAELAFLVLDWALGEDDVERWAGEVTTVTAAPLDPVPGRVLGGIVAQLRQRWGDGNWATLQGVDGQGNPRLALVRHPLCRVDHPLLDQHVRVMLTFAADATPDGLPLPPALEELRAVEDAIVERVGEAAVFVGQETGDRRRVLHLYADALSPVPAMIEPVLAGYRLGRAQVAARPDPSWAATAHLSP